MRSFLVRILAAPPAGKSTRTHLYGACTLASTFTKTASSTLSNNFYSTVSDHEQPLAVIWRYDSQRQHGPLNLCIKPDAKPTSAVRTNIAVTAQISKSTLYVVTVSEYCWWVLNTRCLSPFRSTIRMHECFNFSSSNLSQIPENPIKSRVAEDYVRDTDGSGKFFEDG